ncbi:MAG: hypothetical protein WKF33_01230 [Thermoleophilaceae bacterium]
MNTSYFFTELDPRAAIKGSRDPLGSQAVWAGLGRELIGNLTTVTSSVRNFTTLLVGLHLAELAENHADRSPEQAFLVWEQLAGYTRHCFHGTRGLLGYRKVAARTQRGEATLSAESEGQILGNQKAYGLWGLYTSAARSSGLVARGTPTRLSDAGRRLIAEHHLPALAKGWGRDATELVALARRDGTRLSIRRNDDRLKALATMLDPVLTPAEKEAYRTYLVDGGPDDATGGRQRGLAATMCAARSHDPRVLRADAGVDIATRLARITAAESVLAPAGALFGYLLTQDDRRLDKVALDLRRTWGDALDSVHGAAARVLAGTWSDVAQSLATGEYETSLRLLLRHNRDVMAERAGSDAWATTSEDGRLRVRFRDDTGDLPDRDEVRTLWRNPYFFPSLWGILADLGDVA